MPATNQQTSTISTKLTGPATWRKFVLFIAPLIRLVTCNLLVRGSALSTLWRYLLRARFRAFENGVCCAAARAPDEPPTNRYVVSRF
jgi:hypothetical protein